MEPWYKVATPRKEVREGRSFNPDEFAIALEQVVAGTAPDDYRKPDQFFARTCFTRALREHAGMVLRRLSGKTENTAPVLTLITQFGGGKTHTLTTLYHLANNGEAVAAYPGVADLVQEAGIAGRAQGEGRRVRRQCLGPAARAARTPWIDIARQLAGDKGVEALGPAAKTTPPGTEAIGRLFRGGRRAGAAALRRGAQLPQPPPRQRRIVPRLHPEPDGRHDRHDARRVRHQPAAQPGRDDRVGSAVAGQDHEGRAPRRQGPDRQRRGRDQRGGPPAAVRGSRQREDPQERRPEPSATGASSGARSSRRNGPRWTPRRPRRRRASSCSAASRPATRSTRRRCRCSSASGSRCRSTSRRAARWRCWRSGSRSPRRTHSRRRAPSR